MIPLDDWLNYAKPQEESTQDNIKESTQQEVNPEITQETTQETPTEQTPTTINIKGKDYSYTERQDGSFVIPVTDEKEANLVVKNLDIDTDNFDVTIQKHTETVQPTAKFLKPQAKEVIDGVLITPKQNVQKPEINQVSPTSLENNESSLGNKIEIKDYLQDNSYDCGATALQSILNSNGNNISEKELVKETES